ncbi:MAG: VOC family protein [Pseudomonadota bacterium]
METVAGIGGIFFRAKDPKALGQWYHQTLGIDPQPGFWPAEGGPTVFAQFDRDTTYWHPEGRGWMVNFRVRNLDALTTQLRAQGVEVLTDPDWDSTEFGRFARIHDPEGNPIELWQPADT